MSFVAVAIGGSALVSAGVGAYSANKAADTQANAANNALAFQQQAYNANQPRFATAQSAFDSAGANYKPYLDTGSAATYTLGQLTGTAGSKPDYSSFYNSPDYNFAQQQGELGIERGANARGLNLSGGTLKDLSTFNSGLATQQYGNYYNRLMGLSQMGQNAAAGMTNVASGIGNLATGQANSNNAAAAGIGNTTQAVGQAQASGTVGASNAITGSLSSGISNSLLANYLGKSPSAYSSTANAGTSNAVSNGGFNYLDARAG